MEHKREEWAVGEFIGRIELAAGWKSSPQAGYKKTNLGRGVLGSEIENLTGCKETREVGVGRLG